MSEMIDQTLTTAIDQRWQGYCTQLKVCQREFTEEAVHDLRVSARRLMAVLDIVRILDSRRRPQKVRRFLKGLLNDLDDLRDAQVMLLEIMKAPERPEELEAFPAYLQQREDRFRLEARQGLQGSEASNQAKRIRKIRADLVRAAQTEGFSQRVLEAVDNVYRRARHAASQVDAEQGASIHRARIAFKRFRYATEIVEPLLPAYPQTYFKRMHQYQTALGDIRDLEILLAVLAEFAKSLPPFKGPARPDSKLDVLRRRCEQRHTALVADYMKGPDRLSTFWRAGPDRPFPWEMNNDPLRHPSRNSHPNDQPRRRTGRQPAPTYRQGAKEDAQDRSWIEPAEGLARPDPYKPARPRGADGEDPGKGV